ncbi:SCO family protein [Cryomorpha ignava]|uniref:SCO family protein n=1 Tax=Cryomorpha ignava TaxID=101383 RepID=A0A7K3WVT5_9FLAO|nr:SCO family protein [Cryomorpha ignava]NEN25780.1 SCO family protein [Cryomorpha ignava]
MKTLKNILVLLAVALYACTPNTENANEQNIETQRKNTIGETLPELSIYNLPSTWTTQNGKDIELKDLQGDVVVMVMIYTTCKAACPRLVADMRNIQSQVPGANNKNVKYVLVSIDPETDTPERLKQFAIDNEMDSNQWVFLRGSENDTREFAAVLAVSYKAISPIDFSHSNIISVFDKQGVLVHQKEGLGVDSKETLASIIELSNI